MKELNCEIKAACGKKICCYSCQERKDCKKACLNSPSVCNLSKLTENNKEGAGSAE